MVLSQCGKDALRNKPCCRHNSRLGSFLAAPAVRREATPENSGEGFPAGIALINDAWYDRGITNVSLFPNHFCAIVPVFVSCVK